MRRRLLPFVVLLIAGLAGMPRAAVARIKLITLPARQRVEIQLDHPNATLVEEERYVPLVKGVNQVDFSWANTQIDPGTIVFRVLPRDERKPDDANQPADPKAEKPLDAKVLSVSYPPNEQALVWQVAAAESGTARVRISYLLGNLNKSFNYRAVASHDETTLVLNEYLRVQNLANEAYSATNLWAGFGPRFHKPVGLNQTKEMLAEKYTEVPVQKTYTCDPVAFGYLDRPQNKLMVPMHYVLKNDKAHGLGRAPLQYGKVRLFQEDGHGSTAFLGEDWGKFTPLDDEMRLSIGTAQDIVVKRTIEKNEQQRIKGNLYNRLIVVKYEIENFKNKPVTLDVAENVRHLRNEVAGDTGRDIEWELGKETTFEGGPDKEKSTFDHLVFHAKLPASEPDKRPADEPKKPGESTGAKVVHRLQLVIKNEW